MFAAIARLFVLLACSFALYSLTRSAWGHWVALSIALAVLAIPLGYFYLKLSTLKKYLQADELERLPAASGFLEDLFFRLQRYVKAIKQRIFEVERQHQRFIEAFQASPNGIVMLDNQDQIEWCNAIAERFFGLNFKRDAMQRSKPRGYKHECPHHSSWLLFICLWIYARMIPLHIKFCVCA
jgi:two-component system phosphate regulon sensor histidine kinase PhoR